MTTQLDGILVVALEQAVAAPLATSRLADAGARVVKLERPEGDFARFYDDYAAGHSTYFTWLNRNKESCRVDLLAVPDMALVERMIATADVFVQNLGPGATERLGLGSAALRARYPRLITCDITGYAADTPSATRKAYDLMIQAEAGLCEVTGTAESGPSRIGVSVCDIATGLNAHAHILEALFARTRTGRGQGISVSLFDTAAEMMNVPLISVRNGGPMPRRVGLAHPSIAPYGAYRLIDGTLLIAVQSEREWVQLCAGLLHRPDLPQDERFASNAARVRNRPAMDAIIAPRFAALSVAEAIVELERAKIAYGRVSTMADLNEHPALAIGRARAGDAMVEMAAGPVMVDGIRRGGGSVPALGEHDASLRAEFANGAAAA